MTQETSLVVTVLVSAYLFNLIQNVKESRILGLGTWDFAVISYDLNKGIMLIVYSTSSIPEHAVHSLIHKVPIDTFRDAFPFG